MFRIHTLLCTLLLVAGASLFALRFASNSGQAPYAARLAASQPETDPTHLCQTRTAITKEVITPTSHLHTFAPTSRLLFQTNGHLVEEMDSLTCHLDSDHTFRAALAHYDYSNGTLTATDVHMTKPHMEGEAATLILTLTKEGPTFTAYTFNGAFDDL